MKGIVKITIYVVAFNAEKYIVQTIQSVLAQRDPHWELIIRDNGSTDSTGSICEAFEKQDIRIKVFHNKQNWLTDDGLTGCDRGFYPAAQGEYITFLDADDLLHPNFVGSFYQIAKKGDADLAVAGTLFFQDGSDPAQASSGRFPPALAIRDIRDLSDSFALLYPSLRPMWGKLFHKRLWDRAYLQAIGKPETINNGRDTYFSLGMLMNARSLVSVPTPLHFYRLRANSMFTQLDITQTFRIQEGVILYQRGLECVSTLHIDTPQNLFYLRNVLAGHIFDLMSLISRSAMSWDTRIRFLEKAVTTPALPNSELFDGDWTSFQTIFLEVLKPYQETLGDYMLWTNWLVRLYFAVGSGQLSDYLQLTSLYSAVYAAENLHCFGIAAILERNDLSLAERVLLKRVHATDNPYNTLRERELCLEDLCGGDNQDLPELERACLERLEQEDLEGALACLDKLTEYGPLRPFVLYFRTYFCWQIGEYDYARKISICGHALYPEEASLTEIYREVMETPSVSEAPLDG